MIFLKSAFAGLNAISFSIIFNVHRRDILWVGICGVLGYFTASLLYDYSLFAATLAGSSVITAYSETMARRRKRPATVYLISGLLPIIPGGDMYKAMVFGLQGDAESALHGAYIVLMQMGGIIIAIVLVSSIMKFLKPLPFKFPQPPK